jgi:hypothetical protein
VDFGLKIDRASIPSMCLLTVYGGLGAGIPLLAIVLFLAAIVT